MTCEPRTGKAKAAHAAIAACGLIFAVCSAEAEGTPRSPASTTKGILETAGGTYEFVPTTCAIQKEDDAQDIEVMGTGTSPDGEKFHFGLSSTGNEIIIDLGVDGPFKTSERQIRAGRYVSQAFNVDVSGRTVSVSGLALVDERGQSVDTNARLRIDCSL